MFHRSAGVGSAIRGMLAGGVSGMALNHSDAGGYTGLGQPVVGVSRSRELLLRWVELNVWGRCYAPMRTLGGHTPARTVGAFPGDTEAVVSGPLGRPGVFYRKNDPAGEYVRARLPALLD